jgi:hypothetical protein
MMTEEVPGLGNQYSGNFKVDSEMPSTQQREKHSKHDVNKIEDVLMANPGTIVSIKVPLSPNMKGKKKQKAYVSPLISLEKSVNDSFYPDTPEIQINPKYTHQ